MKVFISQPMTGLTEEEILSIRKQARDNIVAIYGDDVRIIDGYYSDLSRQNIEQSMDGVVNSWDIFWLSESLNSMSEADLIWFVDGWQHSKGCTIEHLCASLYGIDMEFETLATRKDGSYKYGK